MSMKRGTEHGAEAGDEIGIEMGMMHDCVKTNEI